MTKYPFNLSGYMLEIYQEGKNKTNLGIRKNSLSAFLYVRQVH
jgi:hypothetical protein